MGIKTYRPYTPSRRHMTGSDFAEVTKTTPEKLVLVHRHFDTVTKTIKKGNHHDF